MVPKVYPSERLTMQLEKDGSVPSMKEFYEEGSTKTIETKSLTLTFIPTFEDIGKAITCVAELPIDEMEFEPKKRQTSQRLSVNYGPRNTMVSVTPSTTVKEGGAVTMTCTSYGNPAPKISWTKRSISGESQFLSENATLTINNIKAEDLGLYECEGVNQFGREKKTVDLIVQVPPQNTTELISPSDNVDEGENITIMSTTYSNSPPQTVPQKIHPSNTTILSSQNDTSTVSKNDTGIHHETGNNNETRNNTDVIEIAVVEMVKETDYVIPVIVVLSCLPTVAIPALAILVYKSRKAKINGSYSPVNVPEPNV
ncbi:vascular cell adhesion protein 1-like [Terrapene carolina triunguis]|uniref:vascular cell adhesion protein 1-like n=1 Tax=Terrapene triunguis TaxID=2587831 RepID=UPI000E773BF4|nr:vascular cell adhesion protein 1-like [Terrapene carolina triunguis]